MRERPQGMTRLPVGFAKDTAGVCVAELVAGREGHLKHYLYVFVDAVVGGGLVLNGLPHPGVYGNAGAIGSMPLGLADTLQLICSCMQILRLVTSPSSSLARAESFRQNQAMHVVQIRTSIGYLRLSQ